MPQIIEHSLLKTKETPFPILGYFYIQHRCDRTSKLCHRRDRMSVFLCQALLRKKGTLN